MEAPTDKKDIPALEEVRVEQVFSKVRDLKSLLVGYPQEILWENYPGLLIEATSLVSMITDQIAKATARAVSGVDPNFKETFPHLKDLVSDQEEIKKAAQLMQQELYNRRMARDYK